jgi:hypothetical protein
MTIKAGFGIGICPVALAQLDPDLKRVLPGTFELKLGVWLAMHENLRSISRCRAVFDRLASGLKPHLDLRISLPPRCLRYQINPGLQSRSQSSVSGAPA